MNNFNFYNPVKILFGKGKISELPRELPVDTRKVLITYGGGSILKNGVMQQVKAALQNFEVLEFGGIEPNPTFETLMKCVEFIRNNEVDFILAVGGGSVIDGTKFISAAVFADGDPWQIMLTRGAAIKKAMPFGAVLTLPATGSEMNSGGVVTRKSIQAKLVFGNSLVFPKFSILDPETTYSLPATQVANGIVDAYVHIMEQYLTYPVNAGPQDRFAEGLLQTLIEVGPQTLANPNDYDLRANFMWTATLALNGLIGAGVPQDWATHMVGHELTALFGIDHGKTLAILLPGMMKIRKMAKRTKLVQYAKNVWKLSSTNEDLLVEEAIRLTEEFFQTMTISTKLSEYGITEKDIPSIISHLESHGMTALGEHRDVTPQVVESVLRVQLS
ncbi:MAG: iron-containing alcohol dehydrogenase [Ignavibacteria bacterium]|nr:iron-containing alcohol dehydrogenase [Ignavibacteria bacterium]